jgi:Na+/proline symporter
MTPATPVNPFPAILEQVMLLGGFAKVVGVLAFTASLAAITSTADSLIIAISQLVTARRMLSIHSNQQQLVFKLRTWIGRSVSLFLTINCGCDHRTRMGRGN